MSDSFITVWRALDDERLKEAVQGGLNIDLLDSHFGVTLLEHLCTNKLVLETLDKNMNMDQIRGLIAAGANVNVTNDLGEPLLNRVKDPEITKLLIEVGADANKGSNVEKPTSKTVVQDGAAAAQVAGQATGIKVGR